MPGFLWHTLGHSPKYLSVSCDSCCSCDWIISQTGCTTGAQNMSTSISPKVIPSWFCCAFCETMKLLVSHVSSSSAYTLTIKIFTALGETIFTCAMGMRAELEVVLLMMIRSQFGWNQNNVRFFGRGAVIAGTAPVLVFCFFCWCECSFSWSVWGSVGYVVAVIGGNAATLWIGGPSSKVGDTLTL